MKQKIDKLLADDDKLQEFLTWVEQKSKSVEARYKRAAVRAFYFDFDRPLSRPLSRSLDPELERSLQQLKDQLPNPKNEEADKQWWQENGQTWTEQLRSVMIEHRNIGDDWQFSDEEKELLQKYYNANKLLVDCLNSDCYVSREVRQEIEDTLLLPVKRIEM